LFKAKLLITALLLVVYGCSGSRKISSDAGAIERKDASVTIDRTIERNLTNGGFFIHKGRILTSGESGRINLYFTMKFAPPSDYLISIRSKAGMEAFRVYLTSDTVLINDRLNKCVLYGNVSDFERIAGLPAALLKVSIGDLFVINPKLQPDEKCIENEVKLNEYYYNLMVKSNIDCRYDKVKSVLITTGVPDEFITIDYRKNRDDKIGLPKKVEINDFRRKIKITLSLDKYTSPWIGDIKFIPGTGYSVKPLI
jgi:hypothetical protein